jgi:hypothetical protein
MNGQHEREIYPHGVTERVQEKNVAHVPQTANGNQDQWKSPANEGQLYQTLKRDKVDGYKS